MLQRRSLHWSWAWRLLQLEQRQCSSEPAPGDRETKQATGDPTLRPIPQAQRQWPKAHDPAAIQATAAQQGLSQLDAEILTTYVVGMYCPDVR